MRNNMYGVLEPFPAEFYVSYRKYLPIGSRNKIRQTTYLSIIKEFHKEITELMVNKLLVWSPPVTGAGEFYIGEEINPRKYLNKIEYLPSGQAILKKVPNIEMKKVFKLKWNKEKSTITNRKYYMMKPIKGLKSLIGNSIEKINSDTRSKNFRSYPVEE